MKNRLRYLLTILILLTNTSFSQLNDYSYKIGLQTSYVAPQTYFESDGISLLFRPFVRFEFGRYLEKVK